MTTDQLARALVELASDGAAGGPAAVDRLAGIDGRAEGLRRWRTARRTMASGVLAAVALAAFLLAPVLVQPHGTTDAVKPAPDRTGPVADRPPPLVGFPLPLLMRVNDVPYQYYRSEESLAGRDVLRVAVGPSRQPQALAW